MSIAVASADPAASAFNGEAAYASDRIALGDWRSRRDRAIAATASLVAHLVIFGGFAATVWSPAPPLGGPGAPIVQLVSEAELFGRAAGSGLAGSGARASSTPRASGGDGSSATGAANGVRGGTGAGSTAAPRPLVPTETPRPFEAPRVEPRPAPEPAARPATNAAPARRPAPAPAERGGSANAPAPTGATGGIAGASPGAATGAAGGTAAGTPGGVRPRILVPLDGYGLSPYKLFVLCSNRTVFALSEAEEDACNDRQWAAAAQRIVAQNAANPFADEAALVDNDPAWIAELERRRRRAQQRSIGSGVPCDPPSQGATACR